MAAASLSYCLIGKNHNIREYKIIMVPKMSIPFSCQSSRPTEEEASNLKKEKAREKPVATRRVLNAVSELGRRLKDNMSPKQKGDWKDVLLMSLSFGVYVYISQKIVCAYCAWMSMLNQSW